MNREDLFTPFDAPIGIQFEVETALKSEPMLEAVQGVGTPHHRATLHLAG